MPLLSPTADSYIATGSGPLGNSSALAAGRIFLFDSYIEARILLRFSLSAFAGLQLSRAKLKLVVSSAFFPDSAHVANAYEITQVGWTESHATWTTCAAATPWTTAGGTYDLTSRASISVDGDTVLTELDLLELAQEKVGGNLDILIRVLEPGGGLPAINHVVTYGSREAILANRPLLDVATRACLAVTNLPTTDLVIANTSLTNLVISDVGCAS